jgi:hypothetical protein
MANRQHPKRTLKGWRAPRRDETGEVACAGRLLNPKCKKEIEKSRTLWCSQECVDYCMFITHPGFARTQIHQRDNGICAACDLDTDLLTRIMEWANKSYVETRMGVPRGLCGSQWSYRRVWLRFGCTNEILMKLGYVPNQSLWQLDHVIELSDGGSHEPHNCQTLCVPCHKQKTAIMRSLRAKGRT